MAAPAVSGSGLPLLGNPVDSLLMKDDVTGGAAPAAASSSSAAAAAAAAKPAAVPAEPETKIVVDPIVAALWGVVPVAARMFMPDAKEGAQPPLEKVFLVPRQGFLLYHMDGLRAHFSPHAANIHSLWLSIRDERTGVHAYVPWYLPTHVIVDRVMSRCDTRERDPHSWGRSFLPLVVYVHFTIPPVLKKKQRADLAASPEGLLTLKDQPGMVTLHLYRWLKEIYLARFNDLEGFEGDSREAGMRSLGMRLLRAAKDNDAVCYTGVRRDVQKRAAILGATRVCVVVHVFETAGEKPQWRSKTVGFHPAGRTLGRALPELIPQLDAVPSNVLAKDEILPPQYGTIFIQGIQPVLTTPFDVILETYTSVDLALHIVWRPPLRSS